MRYDRNTVPSISHDDTDNKLCDHCYILKFDNRLIFHLMGGHGQGSPCIAEGYCHDDYLPICLLSVSDHTL